MARYGDYETFDEHHRGARVVVSRARRAGGSGDEFAVKVCQVSEWGEPAAEALALDCFIEGVEIQRDTARLRSRHWVPVLTTGRSETEAYWVSPFYPRSLQRVIEGQMDLQASDLHWIASAILRGLADLEAEHKRPHGNLQPANIFIDGTGRLRGAAILLSDPKPGSQLELPNDRVADFHALGRILVHLVRRRVSDLRATIGWPLEPGGEWRRLGRSGEGWREFCNLLLQPNLVPEEISYEDLARRLAPLNKRARSPWVLVTVATIPVCALAGGALYLRYAPYERVPERFKNLAEKLGNTLPDTDKVPEEWAKLCSAYYDWVGRFMLTTEQPAGAGVFTGNAYLRDEVMAPLLEIKGRYESLDPRIFLKQGDRLRSSDAAARLSASSGGGDLQVLAADPPDLAKTGPVIRRTREAWKAIEHASRAFVNWPERARLTELAARLESLGTQTVANELRAAAGRGTDGTIDPAAATDIARLAAVAGRIEIIWADLERKQTALAEKADPVLRGHLALQRERAVIADTTQALIRQLTDAGQETERFAALVGDTERTDYGRFTRESFVAGFSGAVTEEMIARWEKELSDYSVVGAADDPRRAVDWAGLARQLDAGLAALVDEQRASPDRNAAASVERLRTELAQTRQQLSALQGSRLLRKETALAGHTIAALRAEFARLDDAIRAALFQIRPDAGGWLAKVRQVSFGPADGVLQREWAQRINRLLAGVDAASLGKNVPEFRALRERYQQLETFFTTLSGEQGVGALPPLGPEGFSGALVDALQAAAREEAAVALGELVAMIPGGDVVPRVTAEIVLADSRWAQSCSRYEASLGELAEMGRDFTLIERELGGSLVRESEVEALVTRWRGRPALGLVESSPAFQKLIREVGEFARVRGETSLDVLLGSVREARLAVALAAWRRLENLAAWNTPAKLASFEETIDRLQKRVAREESDGVRRHSITSEIQAGGIRWWRAALRLAADDNAMGALLAVREKLGVEESTLAPRERFNVELFRVKTIDWRALPEPELVRQRDEAVARLRGLIGATGEPEVTRWLDTIAALVLTEPAGAAVDLRRLGPGALGWTGELAADGRSVTYRWRAAGREHALNFQLVESDKVLPFFLSTTEFSVGLMMDLMAKPEVAARMLPWLKAAAGEDEDQRLGPQVWRLDRVRGVRLNDRWTGVPLPSWPRQFYPDDLGAIASPTRDDPVHYLPPAAALYLAREVLGCRLPSPDEWTEVSAQSSDARASANIRDASWLREHEYLLAAGVTLDSPLDGDVFRPRAAGPAKMGREAQSVSPALNDTFLWFAPVGAGSVSSTGVRNLFGNVAEYLHDETAGKFFVAGGSALSPPEVDPLVPYPIDAAFALGGFSDVGLRLAFGAPGSLAERNRLRLMLRNKSYLIL